MRIKSQGARLGFLIFLKVKILTKLYIHIGSHKTGTTSIQNACSRLLPGQGSEAPHYIDVRTADTRVVKSNGKLANFHAEVLLDMADRVFRPNGQQATVTSDEAFFWIKDPETVHKFAALLRERFSEVIILCYLRRQDLLALSHRRQVSEGLPAARFYGLHATPLPEYQPHFQNYFDYATKLSTVWVSAFGKENVQVMSYDGIMQTSGDVVTDFSQRLGMALNPLDTIRSNQSIGGNKILIGLKLTQMGIPAKQRRKILKTLPNSEKFRPSREQARAFLKHFERANQQLAQDWSWQGKPFAFGDSFEMYPETTAPRWGDNDVEAIIQAIVTGMRKPQGELSDDRYSKENNLI